MNYLGVDWGSTHARYIMSSRYYPVSIFYPLCRHCETQPSPKLGVMVLGVVSSTALPGLRLPGMIVLRALCQVVAKLGSH